MQFSIVSLSSLGLDTFIKQHSYSNYLVINQLILFTQSLFKYTKNLNQNYIPELKVYKTYSFEFPVPQLGFLIPEMQPNLTASLIKMTLNWSLLKEEGKETL